MAEPDNRSASRRSTRVPAPLGLAAALALAACAAGLASERARPARRPPPLAGEPVLRPPDLPDPGSEESRVRARVRALAVQEGDATYYSDALIGRSTASGEPYDAEALVAAHRELPFGTVVRVTNLRNDRSVVVRIVDRGPWGNERRIIDLSRRAAERIDAIAAGVVPVRLEVLEYGPGAGGR